jgi:hypothetical protein
MPRALREVLMSVGTVTILLMILIAFDDRVHDVVSRRIVAHPSMELESAGHQLTHIAGVVVSAAHSQSIGHAPLLIFALAAAVLTIFMLRT